MKQKKFMLAACITISTTLFGQNQSINGSLTIKNRLTVYNDINNQTLHLRSNSGFGSYIYWAENGVAERGILGFNAGSGDLVYRSGTSNFFQGVERFKIASNGNVGIGTANPDAKLAVNGKIHAEEVKIDLRVAPDYVFQKYYLGTSTLKTDYVMPTLEEVEAFTKVNHHLPEIPSAKQLQKEGMQVGDMVNKLLQKIEELTLYTIEQEKQLKAQSLRIEQLEKSLNND